MKPTLLTGRTGFIGSHRSLVMLEKGFRIYVKDSFENSLEKFLDRVLDIFKSKNKIVKSGPNLSIFKSDIRNKYFLNDLFSEILFINNKIDAIIHSLELNLCLNHFKILCFIGR